MFEHLDDPNPPTVDPGTLDTTRARGAHIRMRRRIAVAGSGALAALVLAAGSVALASDRDGIDVATSDTVPDDTTTSSTTTTTDATTTTTGVPATTPPETVPPTAPPPTDPPVPTTAPWFPGEWRIVDGHFEQHTPDGRVIIMPVVTPTRGPQGAAIPWVTVLTHDNYSTSYVRVNLPTPCTRIAGIQAVSVTPNVVTITVFEEQGTPPTCPSPVSGVFVRIDLPGMQPGPVTIHDGAEYVPPAPPTAPPAVPVTAPPTVVP